jgi:peptidyl-tRNA hydrolase
VTAPGLTYEDPEGMATLTVRTDQVQPRGRGLLIGLQVQHVAVTASISRDEVRELVTALDEWLFDSRPA